MRFPSCVAALIALGTPTILPAQSVTSLQVGALTGEYADAVVVGVRVSPARANAMGVGFSFEMIPQFLPEGAIVGLTDLSLAGTVGLARDVHLELRAGGSALVGFGGGGAAWFGGYHL